MSLDGLLEALRAFGGYSLGSAQYAWLGWLLAAGLLWGLLRFLKGQALALPRRGGPAGAGWLAWLAPLPRSLRYLGLALLLLALLRPQSLRLGGSASAESLDVLMALDISGSMQAQDLKPDRISAAKATLQEFLDRLPGDRVGLVVFAGKAFVQCPLTLDHAVVKHFISQVDLGTVGVDGTALGDGLALAVARLAAEPSGRGKVVVLATDGRANTGLDPRAAAELAAGAGARVYTIGIGLKGGALRRVRNAFGQEFTVREEEPDEPLMRAVAARTGGRYYRAEDAGGLAEAYAQIAALERKPAVIKRRRDADEHFYPYLLAGALLLLAEALLRLRLRTAA